MTKRELLELAKRNIQKAELCRKSGQVDMYKVFIRNAQMYIRWVNRRIYQEKLQRMVTAFPKRISFGV